MLYDVRAAWLNISYQKVHTKKMSENLLHSLIHLASFSFVFDDKDKNDLSANLSSHQKHSLKPYCILIE